LAPIELRLALVMQVWGFRSLAPTRLSAEEQALAGTPFRSWTVKAMLMDLSLGLGWQGRY
jgi:hypothetical protein